MEKVKGDNKDTEDEKQVKIKDSMLLIEESLKNLEQSLKQSDRNDKQLLTNIRLDRIKSQGLSNQLEEAKKENKQLLNILQQKCGDSDLSKRNSQIDLSSSCSTMSMVNLQYKYEELLTSHNGLLKILDMRISEVQKLQQENDSLRMEVEELKAALEKFADKEKMWQDKVKEVKDKKDCKIRKLKAERSTLKMVHNQLVDLLQRQCMEKDVCLSEKIRRCNSSDRALLLQECRKNNLLTYENFKLTQEVQYLRCLVKFSKKPGSTVSKNSIVANNCVE